MSSEQGLTVSERVWARDESLWGGPGVPEIANRLGWLDIADRMAEVLPDLEAFVEQAHADGLINTVLLGMGGSSLGPEVLNLSFGGSLSMLDSTDPAAVLAVVAPEDLGKTIFVVSSKSGGTIETLSHFKHFYELTGGNGSQFVAVTDPDSPLESLAEEKGFRRVFQADPNIGGRYSVLSYFGLVPAALSGVPLAGVLASAIDAAQSCRLIDGNPGLLLGEKLGALSLAGRDKLTFIVDAPIDSFGLWVEQLIAESTGKHGKGILPVAGEPLTPDTLVSEYGIDRVFVHIADRANPDADNAATVDALEQHGQPVFRMTSGGPDDLGRFMFLFEFATAIVGHVLSINPFDQPNVQEAKDATARVLESGDVSAPFDAPAALNELIRSAKLPAYVAIMSYSQPSAEFDQAINDLRRTIRAKTGCATTFGYGPRFLHSTGQLHKGGPPVGSFVQLVHDGSEDVPIPDSSFSFKTLKHAQAIGDLQALQKHGRPVVRLELDGDPAQAVRDLTTSLD
ncbi:MAG: glucose-6-phosphate isomerase [Solirubrobacterales bacterium]|nr:glucose-6-phosphate isomerase [Solirubrobacterales bacterium]